MPSHCLSIWGHQALPSLLPWSFLWDCLSRYGNGTGRRNQPERCQQDV